MRGPNTLSLFHSVSGLVRQSRRAAPLVAGIAVPRTGRRLSGECDRVEAKAKFGEDINRRQFFIFSDVLQAKSLSNFIECIHECAH